MPCKTMVESDIELKNTFYHVWSPVYSKQLLELRESRAARQLLFISQQNNGSVMEHPAPIGPFHKDFSPSSEQPKQIN